MNIVVFESETPRDVATDTRLVQRALKAGWLTPEKRNELQERGFHLAISLADMGDAGGFAKVATLVERMHQSDIDLAIEESKIEIEKLKALAQISQNSRPVNVETRTIEQRKQQLKLRLAGEAR